MARVEVLMPQMGESIAEGTLSKWLKHVGDEVKRDEPLFEISTDKVDAEIPAPSAGVLAEIKVEEGQTVPVQTLVAVIETEKGATKAAAPAVTPARPATHRPRRLRPPRLRRSPRPRRFPHQRPLRRRRERPSRRPQRRRPASPRRQPPPGPLRPRRYPRKATGPRRLESGCGAARPPWCAK